MAVPFCDVGGFVRTVDLPLLGSSLEDLERRGIPVEVRAGRAARFLHSLLELALVPTH